MGKHMLTIKKYSKSCLPGGVYPIVPLIQIELLSFELVGLKRNFTSPKSPT